MDGQIRYGFAMKTGVGGGGEGWARVQHICFVCFQHMVVAEGACETLSGAVFDFILCHIYRRVNSRAQVLVRHTYSALSVAYAVKASIPASCLEELHPDGRVRYVIRNSLWAFGWSECHDG